MSKRDWTYSEGCGCRVTFIGAADFRTSQMLPGADCRDHTGRHQVAERDCLLERAKASRDGLDDMIDFAIDAANN